VSNPYITKYGEHYGYCNACGEEQILGLECVDPDCDTGDVVAYDDDPDPDA
jgi:hypothetical protein